MGATVGRTGEPYEFPLERGKVREFARATKARRDSYHSEARPVVPPTFLASGQFWTGPASSPLREEAVDWSRVLHGEQEYVFPAGPPRAGTVLTATERIEDAYTRQGRRGGTMEFTVLVTEYRDEAGDLVAQARSTIIQTSQPPAAAGTAPEATPR